MQRASLDALKTEKGKHGQQVNVVVTRVFVRHCIQAGLNTSPDGTCESVPKHELVYAMRNGHARPMHMYFPPAYGPTDHVKWMALTYADGRYRRIFVLYGESCLIFIRVCHALRPVCRKCTK